MTSSTNYYHRPRKPYPATRKAIMPIPQRSWASVVKATLQNNDCIWSYAIDEFNERIVKTGRHACWQWLGAWHRQAYGMVTIRITDLKTGKETATKMNTQRLAYAIYAKRALYAHERVRCSCRNLSCTNPLHLQITDYKHQLDHVDFSKLPPRRRKYDEQFFVLNKDVLQSLGAIRLAHLFKVTRGQGESMKRAYLRWINNTPT